MNLVSDGRNAVRPLTIYKMNTESYLKRYGNKIKKKKVDVDAQAQKLEIGSNRTPSVVNLSSDKNIPYNNKYVKFSLSKADAEYNKAVKSGDIETAQRLVDEAAKNAGYTTKAYHGTLTKGITEFKKSFIGSRFSYDEVGFFFTDNLKLAEDYATSEFDADRKGEVISAYIKTSNAFIFDKDYAIKNGYGNVFRDNDIIDVWDNYQSALLDEAEEMRADSVEQCTTFGGSFNLRAKICFLFLLMKKNTRPGSSSRFRSNHMSAAMDSMERLLRIGLRTRNAC